LSKGYVACVAWCMWRVACVVPEELSCDAADAAFGGSHYGQVAGGQDADGEVRVLVMFDHGVKLGAREWLGRG
jgi:hypothetical protein